MKHRLMHSLSALERDFREMSRRVDLLILRAEEVRRIFDRAGGRIASACHCMDGGRCGCPESRTVSDPKEKD